MITYEMHGGNMTQLRMYEFSYDDLSNNGNGKEEKLSYEAQWESLKKNPNRSKLFATPDSHNYEDQLGEVSRDVDVTVKHLQMTDPLCQGKSYYDTMKIAFARYPSLKETYYEKLNRKEIS